MKFLPNNKLSTRFGFTLIELLVVVGIMGALTAFVLPSLNKFGQTQSLAAAANQIVSDIQKTQNNALSGDKSLCAQQLRGWYLYFFKTDSNGIYYQIRASCYNPTTQVWNDLPSACPNSSNPIYLPQEISTASFSIRTTPAASALIYNGNGSIMFYANGSGPSTNPDEADDNFKIKPPGYAEMYGRECIGGGTQAFRIAAPPAWTSKAVITLTPKSGGNNLYITVCNNGLARITNADNVQC